MTSHPETNQLTLSLIDDRIVYMSSSDTLWEIQKQDLAVVGEYTCPSFGDDYFLVFMTATGERYEASFYSKDSAKFLLELSLVFNLELVFSLCNSTELKSRVMWPESIMNKPLFDFVSIKTDSFAGRIKEWVMPSSEIRLSNVVEIYLGVNKNAL